MHELLIAGIAASPLSQSERLVLLALGRGRPLPTEAFLYKDGQARTALAYPPLLWDRPQKALEAFLSLSEARLVTHTRTGWVLLEAAVAALAPASDGHCSSQDQLGIGADDLRAETGEMARLVSDGTDSVSGQTERPVSDGTDVSPRKNIGIPSVSSETGRNVNRASVSSQTPPGGEGGERLNVKTFQMENVERLNVVRAAVRMFVGESDFALWWERADYLWDNPDRIESLDRSLRYARASLETGEITIKKSKAKLLWSQAQRDWRKWQEDAEKALAKGRKSLPCIVQPKV